MDVAAGGVAEETVGAVVAPAHRAAGQPGGGQAQHMLRIGAALHAEGAADILHQDPDVAGFSAEQMGQGPRQAERALAAGV
ncbi:MAG: hypothetical protein F4027_13715 [Rhodospirillaceae bacterium]|nr:hypothetical protein [Rhodospirillaceae bacterium]